MGKAAFIWAYGKDISDLKKSVSGALKDNCYDPIKIYGPISIQSDPFLGQYYDGDCDFVTLRDKCFDHSQMQPHGFLVGPTDNMWIVIDDHSQMTDGKFTFKNGDPNYELTYAQIYEWMQPSNMVYTDCCITVRGQKSGRALQPLCKDDRFVITSMSSNETKDPDDLHLELHFNSCPPNWRDAYNKECLRLQGSGQTPQICPP
ncbi:MAG: hypothetical protein QCI82_04420 [Candidatus Thermoplasmatota archaeon]|nr:hypothetical protein [Candidatus Thermoplasmatota archaeon]